MAKVKYTRKEYREEYLKSEHWKSLRSLIIQSGVTCLKCKERPATDVHHMKYRNIVDVKVKDLVPLCRSCHQLVEEAKKIRLIKSRHNLKKVLEVTQEKIDAKKERMSGMFPIPASFIRRIMSHGPEYKKVVFGILKRVINHPSEWEDVRVTGKQLEDIYFSVPRKEVREYSLGKLKRSVSKRVSIHY